MFVDGGGGGVVVVDGGGGVFVGCLFACNMFSRCENMK